jgi:hypothetical protein
MGGGMVDVGTQPGVATILLGTLASWKGRVEWLPEQYHEILKKQEANTWQRQSTMMACRQTMGSPSWP